MHNLKDLRKNLDIYKKKFKDRNLDFNTDYFIRIDKNNRELINKKELLEQEKKSLSKSKDKSNFKESKDISIKIDEISLEQIKFIN
jgi:seryl-tRNA synthetase